MELRKLAIACVCFVATVSHAFLIVPDQNFEWELRTQRRFGNLLPEHFAANTEFFRLKLKNGKRYSISVVQPEHLANIYFQLSLLCRNNEAMRGEVCESLERDPTPLQGMLHLNRLLAYSELNAAYNFLLKEWKDAGLFLEGYGEGRTRELNTMRDGLWPTLVIRQLPDEGPIDPNADYPIVWVVSYALDYGEGLPWEWRLYHPDFPVKNLARVAVPKQKPRRFIFPVTPYTDFATDPFLSALLSARSYMSGARLEIKNYLKAKDHDVDLAAVVHKLMTRFQFHRWGAQLGFPTPVFRSLLRSQKARFWTKYRAQIEKTFQDGQGIFVPSEANLFIDTAFNPYAFPFTHISEIFVEANSYSAMAQGSKHGRLMLFNRRYAIKEQVLRVEGDPDFGGTTGILRTTPSRFEIETAAALLKSSGGGLIDGAELTRLGMVLTGTSLPLCPQMITWGNLPERLMAIGPEGLTIANPWQQWLYYQD